MINVGKNMYIILKTRMKNIGISKILILMYYGDQQMHKTHTHTHLYIHIYRVIKKSPCP